MAKKRKEEDVGFPIHYFFLPAAMLGVDMVLDGMFQMVPSGLSILAIPVTFLMALYYKRRVKADTRADRVPLYCGVFSYLVLLTYKLPYCGCRMTISDRLSRSEGSPVSFRDMTPTLYSMSVCNLLALCALMLAVACIWEPAKKKAHVYYRIVAIMPALLCSAALLTVPTKSWLGF